MKIVLMLTLLTINNTAFAYTEINQQVMVEQTSSEASTTELDSTDIENNVVENFSQQWGMAAIKIPKQTSLEKLQQWSANISSTLSPPNINIVEQPINSGKISSPQNSINAAFTKGRFRAETGLFSTSSNVLDSGKFYLQGSYAIFAKEKFNLAVTAKFEAVNNPFFNAYIGEIEPIIDAKTIFEYQSKNATIGVISSYSINKQWKVLGAITTTTYEQALQKNPLVDINNSHMALIGTSYSF